MRLFRYLACAIVVPLQLVAAGDCRGPSALCQRLDPDTVVFIGKPVSVAPEQYGAVTVTFDVQELLWGPPSLRLIRVLLDDGYGNGSGRPEFFAVKPLRDGHYIENNCVGLNLPATHPFVDAFRRNALTLRPASVSVKALWQWYVPVAGSDVQLTGEGRTFRGTIRGAAGWDIAALPPGDYTVTATRSNFSQSWPNGRVSIPPASCADVPILMEHNSEVSGRVVDARGEPIRHATFHLSGQGRALSEDFFSLTFLRDTLFHAMGWSQASTAYPLYIHTQTDNEGRFAFHNVFPGWYYLSSDISEVNENFQIPLPNSYYPGVYGWPKAKQLVVTEGQSIRDVHFQLPNFGRKRHVTLLVLSEDGVPVPGAIVQDGGLEPANQTATNSGAHKTSDSAGKVLLDLWPVSGYRLMATLWGPNHDSWSGWLEIPSGQSDLSQTIMLKGLRSKRAR